jgi:DNA topoisomerase-3
MTPAAIRDGFANLRTDTDMQPLADIEIWSVKNFWIVFKNPHIRC